MFTITPPRPSHASCDCLRGEISALEIDIDKPVELFLRHFQKRSEREETGVVHQCVDASKALARNAHHLL
jgi:hypothetical protein